MEVCIANLDKLSDQQVFDHVATKLLAQGARSWLDGVEDGKCAYRDGQGRSCAAGFLISDEEYSESFEGCGNWDGVVSQMEITDAHKGLILRLQAVHDGAQVENWRFELRYVASLFNLSSESFKDL